MLRIYKALVNWWNDIWNPIGKTKVELIALRDFSPTRSGSNVLSIRKGERFLLISDSDKQWWYVRHCASRKRGFVAKTIVAKASDEPHLEWISIETSAESAEKTLLDSRFCAGSFIIRPRTRENISDYLAISVKKLDQNVPTIAHYVVRRENGEFRIDNGTIRFDSLQRLVEHYSGRQNTSKNLELSYCVKKSEAITPWQFDMDVILKGRSLGSGNFGEVFHGTMFGSETVALKSFRAGTQETLIVQEAEIARHVHHENVIRTIGVCRNPLLIITEYMPIGSLHDYLRRSEVNLNDEVKLSIALKIARGMAFLGSKNIVHRDLAARNVLVGETHDVIKIADFGMARPLTGNDYYLSCADKLPWKWTAPEALVYWEDNTVVRKGKVSKASDVWSYGVTLWEIHSKGEEPFKNIPFGHFQKLIEKKEVQLRQPENCPVDVHQLMLRCCSYAKEMRPTFEEICEILSSMKTTQITEAPSLPTKEKTIRPIPRRRAPNRRRYRPRVPCRNRYVIRVAKMPTGHFGMEIPAEPNFRVDFQEYQTVQYLRT